MASLKIEPLQYEELDDYIRVYWAAFEPLEADMVMPMVYPNGLQPDVMDLMKTRIVRETEGKLAELCFCAKDVQTGEVVAVSRWALNEHPPLNRDGIDAEYRKVQEARYGGTPVAGANSELGAAFLRALLYSEYETMRGQPYMCLRLLATHPRHHRKGAGSMLLQQGLDKADRLGLPSYLDASVNGKPLYERFGFKAIATIPFDGRQYGGRSEGKHHIMVRPAQSLEQR